MQKNVTGTIIKIIAIVLMGLTATMNLLGGIGTVCAAFLTENFESMSALLPYQWLYQPLMVLTVLAGIVGGWMTVRLIGGGEKVHRNTLIVLAIGTLLSGIHMVASLAIRGEAVPANMKFYANVIPLVVFLALLLPGLKAQVHFDQPERKSTRGAASGMAMVVVGMVLLSTPMWAGPSHLFEGGNWVDLLSRHLLVGGVVLTGGGIIVLVSAATPIAAKEFRSAAQVK